jgi:hypothetical protein
MTKDSLSIQATIRYHLPTVFVDADDLEEICNVFTSQCQNMDGAMVTAADRASCFAPAVDAGPAICGEVVTSKVHLMQGTIKHSVVLMSGQSLILC